MNAKQLTMAIGALIVAGTIAWLGFLVYAEQPGAGDHEAAGEHAEHAQMLAQPKEASNGQARLLVAIDPQEGAEVGDIVKFTARVVDTTNRPITNVQFRVQHWHTEDEKVVLGTSGVAPDGILTWQFNAHDGVPYEIRVTAAPTAQSSAQFGALAVNPVAFVDPLAPPLRVKLLNTFYLVVVVGLGLATGLWLALRRAATTYEGAAAPPRRPVVAPVLGR